MIFEFKIHVLVTEKYVYVFIFRGVVTVDVQMDYLTINQCPQEFYEANAFKNTARCHFQSTYVSSVLNVFPKIEFLFLLYYIYSAVRKLYFLIDENS